MLSEMTNGIVDNKAESDFGAGVYESPEPIVAPQPVVEEHELTEAEKKAEITKQTMADPETRKLVYDATEYLIKNGIIKPHN